MFRTSLLFSLLAGSILATPVMTPHGARDSASVHLVPEGGSVQVTDSGDVHLFDGSGAIIHISSNVSAAVKRSKAPAPLTAGATVTEASWTNTGNNPISIFEALWQVPPVPAAADGQTLFLFDSLQPAAGSGGLQPVLQFGPSAAGGGAYWSAATWYIVNGQTYYTNPVRVAPGTPLSGLISLTSQKNGKYNYAASFVGLPTTVMQATASAQLVTAAVSLEGYNTKSVQDYPTGKTIFRSIILRTTGAQPTIMYTTSGDNDQGVTGGVNANGPLAQFTITY